MQKKSIIILSAVIAVLLIAGVFAYTQWQKAEQKLAAMQTPDSQDAQQASEYPVQTGQASRTQSPPYGQPGQELPAEEYIPEGDSTPPQPLAIQDPELVVVPSGEEQVYMVPNMVGVYFYGGYWYRYHHGVWFRSNVYNGSWRFVQPAIVP